MFVFFDLFGCIGNREIQRLPVVSLLQRQGIGAVAKQGGVDGYFISLDLALVATVAATGGTQGNRDTVFHQKPQQTALLVIGELGGLLDGVFIGNQQIPYATILIVSLDERPFGSVRTAIVAPDAVTGENGGC